MTVAADRLANHCQLITKGTTPTSIGLAFVDKGVPFLRVGNVSRGSVNYMADTLFIDSEANSVLKRSQIVSGDVLLSIAGTIGRAGVVPSCAPAMNCNQALAIIRTRDSVDRQYLRHWLESRQAQAQMAGATVTGTIQNLSLTQVGELRIPLPPVPEQRRIAAILDQADVLRAKRREALAQLDSLTLSIFIEMFGASLLSPERIPLGDLVQEFRYGTSEKSGHSGFPALRIPNVGNGHLNLSELKTVPVEAAEFKRLQLKSGDLLFVRTNGNPENVGRSAVFEPSLVNGTGFDPAEFIYASYLIRARLKAQTVAPMVLQQYLHFGEGRHAIRAVCKTSAGQYNINTEGLGAVPIPSFPIATQETFAARIQAVESLKTTHRAALAELDTLFASLQHRAFAGQLL